MNLGKSTFAHVALPALCALTLSACGGEGKPADAPGNCPDGTVLKGSDCVPSGGGSTKASSGDDDMPHGNTNAPSAPPSSDSSSASGASGAPAASKTPYDKDAVEIELKRASRQVKANCGSATDASGSAPGPWGKTTASVTLGRNGHIKQVTLPSPYDGTPGGLCAVNSFQKIQFPPYASPSDVAIDWDVELVKPKK